MSRFRANGESVEGEVDGRGISWSGRQMPQDEINVALLPVYKSVLGPTSRRACHHPRRSVPYHVCHKWRHDCTKPSAYHLTRLRNKVRPFLAPNCLNDTSICINPRALAVRKAYKKRALQTHPDRLPPNSTPEQKADAAEQFRLVSYNPVCCVVITPAHLHLRRHR